MIQHKDYKYRIYPTKAQEDFFAKNFGCCRFVYNHFLAERERTYKEDGKTLSAYDTFNAATQLKAQDEYAWLKEVDSISLRECLKDLDSAYKNFFAKRGRYPRFKSRHNHTQSYRTEQINNNVRIDGNAIKLPKVGFVKAKISRLPQGRILNATVTKTASGKYFVSLCVEEELVPKDNCGGLVGIDLGLKAFYTDSNGNTVDNPHTLAKYEKKLAREQRRLSRKQKGSNNRNKQRVKVARLHEKITNTRNDFLHKESTKLVSENQVIAMETLNIKGMVRNHSLAKAISDVSWGRFAKLLAYKATEYGCEVVKVQTFYPSSQTCSCCGYKNPIVKNLSVRRWTCPSCGAVHDRDENAAINILNKGMELLAT